MTAGGFGNRGSTAQTTKQVRQQVQGNKPLKPSDTSGMVPMIVLLVLGTTGLAGLGLHRFFLGQNKQGFRFLAAGGFFLTLMFISMSSELDGIGKLSLACFTLVVLYGCIEAFLFAIRRAFNTIASAVS